MTSSVSWMSFDAEQQRQIHLAMGILSSSETIDELGLGQLRDLVAGTLFPGLTVLHTRIRYLVLTPRTYAALKGKTAESVRAAARQADKDLATDLFNYYRRQTGSSSAKDDVGIIGRDARLNPDGISRPASAAFWPLMRSLGIAKTTGVGDYCRRVAELNRAHAAQSRFLDEESTDEVWTLWSELPSQPKEFSGFTLSIPEARWLRRLIEEREGDVSKDQKSVFAHLAAQEEWIDGLDRVWDHPRVDDFPSRTRSVVALGRWADELTYGARILYNLLCAERRPDVGPERDEQMSQYEDQLIAWHDSAGVKSLHDGTWLNDLDRWVATKRMSQPARARWGQTSKFMRDWHKVVATGSSLVGNGHAAALVQSREDLLKSSRAKLSHTSLLRGWEGDTGLFHLDYNWHVAKRLLRELHAGLGSDILAGGL